MKKAIIFIVVLFCLGQVCSADWLSGWFLRRKITIDHTKFGTNLTHFPLPIFLGSGVGQDSNDVSDVFTNVGDNWKQIAVTEDDGTNQLYVEVEYWDSTNQEAVLWVSASGWTISCAEDTDLYIYFDGTHSDNDAYVGDVGSRTEVWDSNFAAVWHLRETGDGTSGEYIDSTANNADGTGGSGVSAKTPDQIEGKIGKGQDFVEPNDDEIFIGWGTVYLYEASTMQQWFRLVSADVSASCDGWGGQIDGSVIFQSGSPPRFTWQAPGDNPYKASSTIVNGNWNFGAQVRIGGSNYWNKLRLNTSWVDTESGSSGTYQFGRIGNTPYQGPTYPGDIDEFRVSTTNRSAEWLNADYYSHSDDVLTWDETEASSSGTFINLR